MVWLHCWGLLAAANADMVTVASRSSRRTIEGVITTMAQLLKYDTVLGTLADEVSVSGDTIRVGGKSIKYPGRARARQAALGRDLGVDVVIELTGRFTTGPTARAHLEAGAKKVIISAP